MDPPGGAKQEVPKIFGGLSGSYNSVLDSFTFLQDRRWKDWAVKSLCLREGSRVLDIGIGTGVLESRLRRDCSVVGVDVTEKMLRADWGQSHGPATDLLLSDGEMLPLRDSTFDAVVSCYVAKYCAPGLLAAEAARVLRPGGRLALYDFVRPRGPQWPINALYVYAGLPLIGRALKAVRSGAAYTFEALPRIIARTRWDEHMRRELTRNRFSGVEEKQLPGGVAVGFAATKS